MFENGFYQDHQRIENGGDIAPRKTGDGSSGGKNKLRLLRQKRGTGAQGTLADSRRCDASFKVVVLGNSGVGKTSILRALTNESFQVNTLSTIGIDLVKKIFDVKGDRIELEIWDTAGQEQYNSIVTLHFRQAKAFVLVYDITSSTSFEKMRRNWLRSIDEHINEPVPILVAANKLDCETLRTVSKEQGEKFAYQQSVNGFFEISAKTGENIEKLFQQVAVSLVSTWGVPKRWYEMEESHQNGAYRPNHSTEHESHSRHKKKKNRCCSIT